MRVALLTKSLSLEQAGGGEISARLVAQYLKESMLVDLGAVEVPPDVEASKVINDPGSVARFARDADVIHVYNLEFLYSGLKAARRLGIPAVITANSYWASCIWSDHCFPWGERCQGCTLGGITRCYKERNPLTVIRRVPPMLGLWEVRRRSRTLRGYDHIISLSKASQALLVQVCRLPPEKMSVIPNFYDGPLTKPNVSRPKAIFVGALKHSKGTSVLVQSLARLDELGDHDTTLQIVGKGPEEGPMKRLSQDLGVAERIYFSGYLNQPRLEAAYRNSSVMWFPVLWEEPFGRVVLEAWANGVPIVSSRVGGPGDLIQDGVNGLLVEPGDSVGIAKATRRILREPGLASELRENGHRAIVEFRPERVVARFREVYARVAGTR